MVTDRLPIGMSASIWVEARYNGRQPPKETHTLERTGSVIRPLLFSIISDYAVYDRKSLQSSFLKTEFSASKK